MTVEVSLVESNQPKRRGKKGRADDTDLSDAGGVDLGKSVSEFTQLALYMAASLAGLVTAVLIARRPFFESLLRRAGGQAGTGMRRARREASRPPAPRAELPPTPEESLPLLADAIIGNTKTAVASVFGPPRSAAVEGVVKANTGTAGGYWTASTWYYPMPRNNALAMAIEFVEDNARRVEFVRAPGV